MSDSSPSFLLDELSQSLKTQGWYSSSSVVPHALCKSLHQELLRKKEAQQLKKAQIGMGTQKKLLADIRGDSIAWLEDSSQPDSAFLAWLQMFMNELNARLFLNLNEAEIHYAFYPPETVYQKHLDVFQQSAARKISLVLYLNPDWQPDDGGELILYKEHNPEEELQRISPEFGRVVVFLSSVFYHQVNLTKRERFSVTGWLKNRV